MDVGDALRQLPHVIAHLRLRQGPTTPQHMYQTPPGTILEDDVDVRVILEVVMETNNMAMSQVSVDLDLSGDLLLVMALSDPTLGDDLASVGLVGS